MGLMKRNDKSRGVGDMLVFAAGMMALALAASAVSAAEGKQLAFSHPMPKETNEAPTNPPREEMMRDFRDPFGKVRTGVYWYWLSGNISEEGIRRDLEAMRRAGIDRAYIGDVGEGGNKPGEVRTFSEAWWKALQTAFETAAKLDIEIGLFNSPGWSQSGGPWITHDRAMRRLVHSEIHVTGPQRQGPLLPKPVFDGGKSDEYQDVAVLAYPLPAGAGETLASNGPLEVQDGKPFTVELTAPKPFTARSLVVTLKEAPVSGSIELAAEVDGVFKPVVSSGFARNNKALNVGFIPFAPVVLTFAPVQSTRFRVTLKKGGGAAAGFAAVKLSGAPGVASVYEKTLAKMFETPLPMWNEYQWPQEAEAEPGTMVDPAKVVILTGKLGADGRLAWQVPPGEWAVLRIGMTPTRTRNAAAVPEATGYEVDKMSKEHVAFHFASYLKKILDRTPSGARKAITTTVLDSYEVGGQNFTDGFIPRFKAAFGYDPTPYLPAFFGIAVGSRRDSDRFLWDVRRFVADEVAYSYVAGLREASRANGMKTWLECYGHWGFPGEFLQYGGQSDGIAGEFWSEGSLGDIENRAASSCGHIYGKRLIWSESNTCGGSPFARSPADLKARADRFFAEGINATLLHLYAHQAYERAPGITAWFGNEFNRHNTWFDQMDLLTGYWKRVNYLLQQGLNVADIAYFIGEDAPKMTGIADPAPPSGRQFDYINGEVLRETASVDEVGRLVLPHGTRYEVLVLPNLETMRPELLQRIEALVQAGAFVMGPKPLRSPSLAGQPAADQAVKGIADRLWGNVDGKQVFFRQVGKGTIAWGLPLEKVFAMRRSITDCAVTPGVPLAYAHRTMPNADVYFLSNQSNAPLSDKVLFRAAGRIPEYWQAMTGEIREAPVWRAAGDATEVVVTLAPHESLFVVFSKPAGGRTGKNAARETVLPLKGEWTLSFQSDPLHRGPAQPVKTAELFDLSKHQDPAIRFYSGKVIYRTTFQTELPAAGERVALAFGKVCEIARVRVNGQDAGGVWSEPFSVPVTGLLKAGENTLEVELCTSWLNRLVGDAALPADQRPTWISVGGYPANRALKSAGLLGPVTVERLKE